MINSVPIRQSNTQIRKQTNWNFARPRISVVTKWWCGRTSGKACRRRCDFFVCGKTRGLNENLLVNFGDRREWRVNFENGHALNLLSCEVSDILFFGGGLCFIGRAHVRLHRRIVGGSMVSACFGKFATTRCSASRLHQTYKWAHRRVIYITALEHCFWYRQDKHFCSKHSESLNI